MVFKAGILERNEVAVFSAPPLLRRVAEEQPSLGGTENPDTAQRQAPVERLVSKSDRVAGQDPVADLPPRTTSVSKVIARSR